tara:strand:+ start:5953 stop:6546 length:594 start_codon:yes stop_codon:yes gene_type:complete
MKPWMLKIFVVLALVILATIFTISFFADQANAETKQSQKKLKTKMNSIKKVEKTEEEWKQELTEKQFHILRKAGTERPFGKEYDEFKKQGGGKYLCAGCGSELFTSETKFDSKCGWPSFFDPADAKNVNTFEDFHLGYLRTEVRCAGCDGHLGHVFKGEGFDTPTDKRYCINGAILRFVPFETEAKATSKEENKSEL